MIFKIIIGLLCIIKLCLGQELFDIRVDALPSECLETAIPASCAEATACTKKSGYYTIRNPEFSTSPFTVLCDADTDGGGWTVVQLRQYDGVNFSCTWSEYESGFGRVDISFFIGFEKLLAFQRQMGSLELYVELQHGNDRVKNFAKYDNFVIGGAAEEYELKSLGRYSGNTQDALGESLNYAFSTFDHNAKRCGEIYGGGWWYLKCLTSNINGKYGQMEWGTIDDIKFAKMMIRRRQFTDDCKANELNKKCNPTGLPTNCAEAIACTGTTGINVINQAGFQPYPVQCIADIDGGDWLVVLSRQLTDHNYNWNDYITGFGNIDSKFYFIGLEKLYKFGPQEMLFQFVDYEGKVGYAKYDNFIIGNATEQYAIKSLGKYSGTAGNLLGSQMFLPFSPKDCKNDKCTIRGWWCAPGLHLCEGTITLYWYTFSPYPNHVISTRMMIRPRRLTDQCKPNHQKIIES